LSPNLRNLCESADKIPLCFSGIGEGENDPQIRADYADSEVLLRNTGLWIAGTYRPFPLFPAVPTTKEYASRMGHAELD
jgi:hypothetical protein